MDNIWNVSFDQITYKRFFVSSDFHCVNVWGHILRLALNYSYIVTSIEGCLSPAFIQGLLLLLASKANKSMLRCCCSWSRKKSRAWMELVVLFLVILDALTFVRYFLLQIFSKESNVKENVYWSFFNFSWKLFNFFHAGTLHIKTLFNLTSRLLLNTSEMWSEVDFKHNKYEYYVDN